MEVLGFIIGYIFGQVISNLVFNIPDTKEKLLPENTDDDWINRQNKALNKTRLCRIRYD